MSFRKLLIKVFIGVFIFVGGLLLIVNSFMSVSLKDLKGKGDYVEAFSSPNDEYEATMFVIFGNATNGNQVRVAINSKKDGKKEFDDETIYWLYPVDENLVDVSWVDNQIIEINDQIIDIKEKKTYYNWRKDKSLDEE